MWTSQRAARYHFVPDFEGDDLSRPTWRLYGDFGDEGYTPPYAPFYALPLQIARFRTSTAQSPSQMRLAVAGSAIGTPIEEAAEAGYLVLSDAPESFPLTLQGTFNDGRVVYLAQAPPERYVTSFEVLTEAGIGWHREMLEPIDVEGAGLSDVLLYEPLGRSEPDSLLAAASQMFGSTEFDGLEEVGLFWEVYGAEAEEPIEFELQIEREEGGFFDRLRRLLPGGSEERTATLGWSTPARGAVDPTAIALDVSEMPEGEYTIVLRARWAGQPTLETRRRMVVW